MANQTVTVQDDMVRCQMNVIIPEIPSSDVTQVRRAILDLLADYEGSTVNVNMSEIRPTPRSLRGVTR